MATNPVTITFDSTGFREALEQFVRAHLCLPAIPSGVVRPPAGTAFGFRLITGGPRILSDVIEDRTKPLTTFDDDRGEPSKTKIFRAAHGRPLRFRRVLRDGVITIEPTGEWSPVTPANNPRRFYNRENFLPESIL